jgi:hypothetical protein
MVTIRGTVVRGKGWASECIEAQWPSLIESFPDIAGCRHATINVGLERLLVVTSPNHSTPPFTWQSRRFHATDEVIDFLRIEFEIPKRQMRRGAWLYLSRGSLHRQTPWIHEIVAPELGVIPLLSECAIYIDREMPDAHQRAVIIL